LIGIETFTHDEIEEIRATCAAKAGRAVNNTVVRLGLRSFLLEGGDGERSTETLDRTEVPRICRRGY
jgi:hypothetical protein